LPLGETVLETFIVNTNRRLKKIGHSILAVSFREGRSDSSWGYEGYKKGYENLPRKNGA